MQMVNYRQIALGFVIGLLIVAAISFQGRSKYEKPKKVAANEKSLVSSFLVSALF